LVLCAKADCAVPDHTKPDCFEPDHGEPNQELHQQIVKCRQKREQSWLKITDIFFCFDFVHCLNFLKMHDMLKASSVSIAGHEKPNLVEPLD